MSGKQQRPEERFVELLADQLLTDFGYEKASEVGNKVRERMKQESGNQQHSVISNRFMMRLTRQKDAVAPIRALQEDPSRG